MRYALHPERRPILSLHTDPPKEAPPEASQEKTPEGKTTDGTRPEPRYTTPRAMVTNVLTPLRQEH
jgi:hypothetical protein